MREAENERALFLRAQTGEREALEELTRAHLPLVRFVARRAGRERESFDDLCQWGALGLLKAIKRFDPDYGVRFSTYAVPVIWGEIRRFQRDDGPLRVSRSIRENAERVYACAARREAETGASPSLEEIAAQTGLSREEALLALGSRLPPRSLDEPLRGEGEGMTLGETLGADGSAALDERLSLHMALAALPERERILLTRRYFADETQTQVARALGVSQVQVSRLEKRVMEKLRARLAAG